MNIKYLQILSLFIILTLLLFSCEISKELQLDNDLLEEVKNNAEKYENNKIMPPDETSECNKHSYVFSYDSEYHYEKCISCGNVLSKETHTLNESEIEYGITVLMNKVYYYKILSCTQKCKLNVEYVPYFDFAQETSDD